MGKSEWRGDRHRFGLFPPADWVAWFEEAGFDTRIHNDPWKRDVFVHEGAESVSTMPKDRFFT